MTNEFNDLMVPGTTLKGVRMAIHYAIPNLMFTGSQHDYNEMLDGTTLAVLDLLHNEGRVIPSPAKQLVSEGADGERYAFVYRSEYDALAVKLDDIRSAYYANTGWTRFGFRVRDILSEIPADALAAHDTSKWDEGFRAGRNADHNSDNWPKNPYRIKREDGA